MTNRSIQEIIKIILGCSFKTRSNINCSCCSKFNSEEQINHALCHLTKDNETSRWIKKQMAHCVCFLQNKRWTELDLLQQSSRRSFEEAKYQPHVFGISACIKHERQLRSNRWRSGFLWTLMSPLTGIHFFDIWFKKKKKLCQWNTTYFKLTNKKHLPSLWFVIVIFH